MKKKRIKDTAVLVPMSLCPVCGHPLDAATVATGNRKVKPKEGDVSVCISCASPLVFNYELRLREATPEELARLDPEAAYVLQRLRDAIKDLEINELPYSKVRPS